jgi:hypothetical protein
MGKQDKKNDVNIVDGHKQSRNEILRSTRQKQHCKAPRAVGPRLTSFEPDSGQSGGGILSSRKRPTTE